MSETSAYVFPQSMSPFREEVNLMVTDFIDSRTPEFLRGITTHALFPGRRVRPALMLMLASTSSPENQKDLKTLCLGIELLHRSAIIIDDLVDLDTERRGEPTFHTYYDPYTAILISHFLTAEALRLGSDLPEQTRCGLDSTYSAMSISELADISPQSLFDNPVQTYKDTVVQKTAALFELALLGASGTIDTGEQMEFQADKLGHLLGSYYQMTNDRYDVYYARKMERGIKKHHRVSLNLPHAILLDQHSEDTNYSDGVLTTASFSRLQRRLQQADIQTRTDAIIADVRKEFEGELEKSPLHWQSTLKAFLTWVDSPAYWDQGELQQAGY